MGIWTWLTQNSAGVTAVASVLNVAVLAVYSWFTWGIWDETREASRHTQDMLQHSRDDLDLKVIATYLQGISGLQPPPDDPRKWVKLDELRVELSGELLLMAFPKQHENIERIKHRIAMKMRGA